MEFELSFRINEGKKLRIMNPRIENEYQIIIIGSPISYNKNDDDRIYNSLNKYIDNLVLSSIYIYSN